jgi:hypothetical protein
MPTYRIYKQLIPAPLNEGDPSWAKRQVWVAKLNSEDTVDEFDTLAEAEALKSTLESNDPTERQYKITEIADPIIEEEVTEE